jgi:eukaryotic-like serine/threonine-protein kinase
LTADLPAFDSVWIDALVQQKTLTPFQASQLESSQPERVALGDYLLIDRLGGRSRSETFLARGARGRQRFALKVLTLREEQRADSLVRLRKCIASLARADSNRLAIPREAWAEDERIIIVSHYAFGLNLRDLLVRRGRFPVPVVRAIARQVLSALIALRGADAVHGDLRLENIKLSPRGRAVLLEPGIRTAISPQLNYLTDLTLEQCETVAPELVASGRTSDERSELYSLGCTLWNLLTGRPPIQEADPLAKLAAHQQRAIRDPREWAPEIPDPLAEAVMSLLQRDPGQRPATFAAAQKLFGKPRLSDRRLLREYQAYFLSQAPAWTVRQESESRSKWPAALLAVLVLSGMSYALFDEGARTELLHLATRVSADAETFLAGEVQPILEDAEEREAPAASLPQPNPDGVIELSHPGPYRGEELSVVGPLTIRCSATTPATILCDDPLTITCETLTLEHLRFQRADSASTGALVVVRSFDLAVADCRFEIGSLDPSRVSKGVGLAWKSPDLEDRSSGRVTIERCRFLGGRNQMYFATTPVRGTISDTLSLGGNTFCRIKQWPLAARPASLRLERVCLRETSSLLHFDANRDSLGSVVGELRIDASQSVFHLGDRPAALFAFSGEHIPPAILTRLSFFGEDCFGTESLLVAGRRVPETGEIEEIPSDRMNLEGLVRVPVTFAGPVEQIPTGSFVTEISGPRFSSEMPGLRPE